VSTQIVLQPVNVICPGRTVKESDSYDSGEENLEARISLIKSETILISSETQQNSQLLGTTLSPQQSRLSPSASCLSLPALEPISLPGAVDERLLQVSNYLINFGANYILKVR